MAAWMMSTYGATVTRGSIVATLQSIGAAGMGSVAKTVVAMAGALPGCVIGGLDLPISLAIQKINIFEINLLKIN